MARAYPPEVREFIIENVRGRTSRELADMVNAEFGLDITPQKIASTKKNWGLVSGTPCGLPAGAGSKVFPREIVNFIMANYKGTGHQEMADRLREEFGREYTREQIKNFYNNHHLDSGIKGHFQKGHVPHNKGKTWDEFMSPEAQERSRRGQFKKGNLPHNTRPIGHERVSEEGYTYVKVRQRPSRRDCNDNFVAKQRLVWEEHYGPVPEGCMVGFANGDPADLRIENLVLETKQQHAVKNRCGIHGYDRESAQTANMIADIKMQIRRKRTATHEQHEH